MKSKLSARLEQMRKMRGDSVGRKAGASTASCRGISEKSGKLFEEWHREAPLVLSKSISLPFPPLALPYRGFLVPRERLEKTIFYDFETTGLSGGAGTFIFLAGVGRLVEGELRIDQVYLEDYPGEPDFLEVLGKLFSEDDICVSYNGKRFDRHLLTTRTRMSGVDVEMGPQLDLLYPSRSLWKQAIGSCRLANVEARILGRGRDDDIDGALIPDCYFEFLRGRENGCMEKVIHHHFLDIESLVYLLFHIEAAAAEPERLHLPGAREGLSALLLKRGFEDGLSLLEKDLEEGSMRAGKMAALAYRYRHRYEDFERVLIEMWKRERGFFQGLALAKHYEHRKRDPAAALETVDKLIGTQRFLPRAKREDLEKRRARLTRKLERS